MFIVVPGEELLAEGPAVLSAAKPVWELGVVFHGAELDVGSLDGLEKKRLVATDELLLWRCEDGPIE